MIHKQLLACLMLIFVLAVVEIKAQDAPAPSNPKITPEKQALIKELIEVTRAKQTIEAMVKAQSEEMERRLPELIWVSVAGMEELKALTPVQKEELKSEVMSKAARTGRRMYDLLMQNIDFEKLINEVSVPAYDKYFTEAELRDLVAFYNSTTGKKVIEVTPSLIVESMTRTADIVTPKIVEAMTRLQREETEAMTKEIQAAVKPKQKPAKAPRRPGSRRSRP